MSTGTFHPADGDDPVAAAVCDYLAASDAGRPIPPADWLARYPDLAAELRQFLDEDDGIEPLLRAFARGGLREPDLRTAERFVGDYELLERIGGNMGVVYRARQQSLPREVAVKLLLRPGEADRERFRAEAEAMARLNHPHVARILEVARGVGVPFLSMEWYPGGALNGRLTEFMHDPDRAAELVGQVARAVHHAHQRGILHRDLKPANVLLDDAGRPYVADFGLAVLLGTGEPAVRVGAGTPAYMAPEQLTGDVTVATDVHGLGALFYALLTGRPPFAADTLTDLLDQVRTVDPVAPRRLNPRVDPDLEAVCCKCLRKDPADRYPTAAAVADDLESYREGERPTARPLGPLGRAAHVVRQARAAADFRTLGPALLTLALFALLTNVAVYGLFRMGAAEAWAWVAVFASYVPLYAFLIRDWRSGSSRRRAGRRHLWSVWLGHAAACVAVFVALRITAGPDAERGFDAGYVACAGVNALAFAVMGSLFAGRLYLFAATWLVAAVGMAVLLPWAPLIYAVLIAGCSLLTGLQLRGLVHPDAADEPGLIGDTATG
ncbi:MAG TPA: serine/threonine-protein kinase [Gemmataceae bacterium]|nr:serine/threonine-protein kinase [Gemmataceae bacterium]